MIEVHHLTSLLEFAVSAITLLVVLLKLWPHLRLDAFRQQMFAIRDELFDYALAGNIEFSHPAYRLLRRSMNGYIRYAHQLTFFRLCLTALEWKFSRGKPDTEWLADWSAALKTVNSERVKDDLQRFHTRAFSLVFRRIILGSPLLMCAVTATTLDLAVSKGLHNVRQLTRTAGNTVISGLIDPTLIEEEAARCAA